ncbi:MAG: helix-turn-helix domain-containing protein [Dehalococcoidia bacterium]|nr:helix-turn-helix domain-containing protein [Dehalococcoidia bacterium]
MYTTKEAAAKMGVDESHIRRLLIEGKLKGQKFGRDWMVLELDYKRKRKAGGGRKPKQKKGGNNEPNGTS